MCYDQNGNMPRRNATTSSCTNGDTLSYDDGNRLTSITVGATTTNYFYSGDGARVKKSANGVTTYYVGNLYEYTVWTGGSSTSKYYYFGGQRVAVKQDINVSYIHGDHLGSTSKTTGASASTQTYYPYGAIKTSSGTPPTDYGYTGQKRDASANLMFYGARYYDPALGRFIQPDSIVPSSDPQNLNRYSYVHNNPLNFVDPSGHDEGNCEQQNPDCDRYYHAQGLCWNARLEKYSRSCPATVENEEDLEKIAHEHPEFLNNPNLQFLFGYDTQRVRVEILTNVGIYLVEKGETDLEVLVKLAQIEFLMAPNGFLFIDDLSMTFLGWHYYDAWQCVTRCPRVPPPRLDNYLKHGGSGFSPFYQDPNPGANQVYHFWEYVDTGFHLGYEPSLAGAIVHEIQGGGQSVQDTFLGERGAFLGGKLRFQIIIDQSWVAGWLTWQLGPNSPGPFYGVH
ncbi:MAG: RHS repeat-associated core domain-containing protein [Chloroflexota bacterium]|nr:MAG: RHS repeat-associated core domain-containing protein [Chloroflexota bacterium]